MKLLQTKTLGAAEETHIRFLNPSLSHRGSSKKKKKKAGGLSPKTGVDSKEKKARWGHRVWGR